MAISPRIQNPQVSYTSNWIPGKGYVLPDSTSGYQTAPYPITNPPALIGVDYVQISLPSGISVVTFPNLPVRGTANPANPQRNQPQTLNIQTGDLLLFVVSLNTPGVVTPRVLDINNTPYTAPALSYGTYRAFQATVSLTSAADVIVYGTLYLQKGVLST